VIDRNVIHCGDAQQLIQAVPDESIDLVICDGPYGVSNNSWDHIGNVQGFNLLLIKRLSRKLKRGGSLYLFGKADCLDFIDYRPFLRLRSRIVWYQPSRLGQGRFGYTNNYDVICYFVKGDRPNAFNLDDIRVPQLVELGHRLRCERVPSVVNGPFGKTKFNEKGKNPGDVWGDIKQLTYKSKELVNRGALHTIQKPERLIERLVLASSSVGDIVLDPFAGVGTVAVVCKRHQRNFVAFEINPDFVGIGNRRLADVEREGPVLNFSGHKEDISQDYRTCSAGR